MALERVVLEEVGEEQNTSKERWRNIYIDYPSKGM